MLRTGNNTPIISPCSRLVWAAWRQQDLQERILRLWLMDNAIRNSIMADAPPLKYKDLAIRSGNIDGLIDANGLKLLYIAISFDDEPLDSHLLHAQRQMYDLRARPEKLLHVDYCFMLVANKSTGRVREMVLPYDEKFVFDYQVAAEADLPGMEVLHDQCLACPLRFDCKTFEAYEDGL